MAHNIAGIINNNSDQALTYQNQWFEMGSPDGDVPAEIPPGTSATFQASGFLGCSGWIQYQTTAGWSLYFAFSNPTVGLNGIDVGTGTDIWDDMTGQYYGLERIFNVTAAGEFLRVRMLSTGGDSTATWDLDTVDVSIIVPAAPQLPDVLSAYNALPLDGVRTYYGCRVEPTTLAGLARSHFKGMSFFDDKLILTHTNLGGGSDDVLGKIVNLDRPENLINPGQGMSNSTSDTTVPGWSHPCSSQACGSFLAMGLQENAESTTSIVQIYDNRAALINGSGNPIATINIADGVNGVGLTKQTDATGGKYVVAAVNGQTLQFFASVNPQLDVTTPANNTFEPVGTPITNFQDSGAGLALITQGDGTLFAVALNANDDGSNNTCNLYEISGDFTAVKQVETKTMTIPGISDCVSRLETLAPGLPTPFNLIFAALLAAYGEDQLNTSFRWGKGLSIQGDGSLAVYATDRNAIPWSQIPLLKLWDDFSVVQWG